MLSFPSENSTLMSLLLPYCCSRYSAYRLEADMMNFASSSHIASLSQLHEERSNSAIESREGDSLKAYNSIKA